jgi:flagellar protein FlbT
VPLKIDLKPGDKIIINGAVLQNAGSNAKLLIHNESAILRGKEIMTEKDVTSPAAHIYFALQCAYMFPDKLDHYVGQFSRFAEEYLAASPSSATLISEIVDHVQAGGLYKALKSCQKLMKHEAKLMEAARKAETKLPEGDPTDEKKEPTRDLK